MSIFARKVHCLDCDYEGPIKDFNRGSFFIELVLWCCFLLPGLIYSLWRTSASYKGCPDCKGKRVIDQSAWDKRQARIAKNQSTYRKSYG